MSYQIKLFVWKTFQLRRLHLQKFKTECLSRIKILKVLGNNTWGSEKKSLLTIYKSLILSVIDYGDTIYNSAKNNVLNTINPIHNQGIRLETRAFRTSPIDSILSNTGELPLELRRQNLILKYILRIKSLPNHISNNILQNPSPPTHPTTGPQFSNSSKLSVQILFSRYKHWAKYNVHHPLGCGLTILTHNSPITVNTPLTAQLYVIFSWK